MRDCIMVLALIISLNVLLALARGLERYVATRGNKLEESVDG